MSTDNIAHSLPPRLPASLPLSIIYAATARGSHHKMALDALDYLTGADGGAWRRVFYKHAVVFATGAKVPDDEFKDFKNHVLHVRDGYWGGAAEKVENWYAHLVKELRGERWREAVWAAGVLSHYYTDPIHPFHTAQSDAENSIHRAVEWSISRSFDVLAELGRDEAKVAPQLQSGPDWLRRLVVDGAETGNRQYEKLIAHYDIHRGVIDPPAGLDIIAQRVVAGLINYATRGFALVLGKAIAEAGVKPPEVGLGADVLAAIARLPRNWLTKRRENAAERKLVEAMYDELKATGQVDKTLPEDERIVRELYLKEVLEPQLAERNKARGDLIAQPSRYERGYTVATPQTAKLPAAMAIDPAQRAQPLAPAHASEPVRPVEPSPAPVAAVTAAPVSASPPAPVRPAAAPVAGSASTLPPVHEVMTQLAALADRASASASGSAPAPAATAAGSVVEAAFGDREASGPRVYLALSDDVERAPSIGPKMAERLYALGIRTVADLLKADADQLSLDLDAKNVWDETVRDWQSQARLVCDVPGLRGTHAQLLVGAGYRTREAIASAVADKLCADVLAFAVSAAGQRILRDGHPPDIEKIKSWLESARAARAA